MSIASEITRLQNAKSALKTSINAKTDSAHQIDDETLDEYSDFVDSIQTGGGGSTVEEKDVNFYDYDGTLVDSYSKADFLALNSLPENPTHTGLTAKGWNWSLADAKTFVTTYNELDIGQMYITDNGATRIYIRLEDGRLSPYLGFAISGTATIDWGDNSTTNTVTGSSTSTVVSTQHSYASPGDYVISISSESKIYLRGNSTYGSQILWDKKTSSSSSNRVYQNAIVKVELGNCYLSSYAFEYCYSLENIILSNTVTFLDSSTFFHCYSLKNVIIPTSITNIQNYAFEYCYSLEKMILSNTVTTLYNYIFAYCYSLKKIIIPTSITSLGNHLFDYCDSLNQVIIPNTVTSLGSDIFNYCYNLKKVTIPNNITTLSGGFFLYCYALRQVTLPNTLTSIASACFRYCYSLSNVKIPSGVSTIESYTFNSCYSLGYIDFTDHITVPSLSNTNALQYTPTDCKIIVPDSLYSTWIGETNWSSYASRIIKESDYNA